MFRVGPAAWKEVRDGRCSTANDGNSDTARCGLSVQVVGSDEGIERKGVIIILILHSPSCQVRLSPNRLERNLTITDFFRRGEG